MQLNLTAGMLALMATLNSIPITAAELEVTVTGVEHGDGAIRVMLYREQGFLDREQVVRQAERTAAPGDVTLRLEGVDPGRYAVILYHDEDGNGELNRLFGTIPLEAYGLSNNLELRGPPRFSQAAFELPPDGTGIEVRLNY